MYSRWPPPCARTGGDGLREGEHIYSLWFQARGTATGNYSGKAAGRLAFYADNDPLRSAKHTEGKGVPICFLEDTSQKSFISS